ncbi:MAG: BrnA antitoxin family protein [Xanthobacteraceae bacterium]|nr:BrnA antitoxin family protein [Xanthobacteraceae bacterium]
MDASPGTLTGGRRKAIARASDWKDPDDAPEVTDEMLDRATYRDGDKVIRPRGRPPLGDQSKTQVTLRLDSDVVRTYRATGEGWQSRINADLRRSAGKWRKA